MSKLHAKERNALPNSAFALPGRRFPIEDAAHRTAALRMAHYASPSEQAIIRKKVAQKSKHRDVSDALKRM